MRRIACALVLVSSAVASAGPARAVVPVADYVVPGGHVAACLRDAGPGRFAMLGALGRTTTSMNVLQVADGTLTSSGAPTRLGWLFACPAVAGAGSDVAMGSGVLVPGLRAADGYWSAQMRVASAGTAPQPLGRVGRSSLDHPAIAVNASGAAVLAWIESGFPKPGERDSPPTRVLAALRPAGSATFGAPVVLDDDVSSFLDSLAVGVDDAGRASVAFIGGDARTLNPPVVVATSDARGSFAARQELDRGAVEQIALTVNPDGRALLAVTNAGPTLYERLPGESRFAELPALPDGAVTSFSAAVAIALGRDGEAIVATGTDDGGVSVSTRPRDGAFGPWSRLAEPQPSSSFLGVLVSYPGDGPSVPIEADKGAELSVAVRDAQATVAWLDTPEDGSSAAAYAAFGTVAGGFGRRTRLGNPCRPANAVRAVVLPDGTVAVAWSDNARTRTAYATDVAAGDGHLGVVRNGIGRLVQTARPQVIATVASSRAMRIGDPLRVRVRCTTGPCDVRAIARTRAVASPWWKPPLPKGVSPEEHARTEARLQEREIVGASTLVPTGRTATLRLAPNGTQAFVVPRTHSRGQVALTACSPDGSQTTTVTLRPRLRGGTFRPMPRITAVRATRRGRSVHVAVRTDRPVRGAVYAVGRPERASATTATTAGHGRRSFALALSPSGTAAVRAVEIQLINGDGFWGPPRTVKVR